MRCLFIVLLLAQANCSGKEDKPSRSFVPKTEDSISSSPQPVPAVEVRLDYDTALWSEITRVDSTILLDLRYATTNNFVKEKMYECPRCFLRPEVANAVAEAHRVLAQQGLGLKMYDCYRPLSIQWRLWNKMPNPNYVADPRRGSMHNRGMAVDLVIVDNSGKELDMGTEYDFFGEMAYHDYEDLPEAVLSNRALLLQTMESHGFRPTRTEWWHYSFIGKAFPLDKWTWDCN